MRTRSMQVGCLILALYLSMTQIPALFAEDRNSDSSASPAATQPTPATQPDIRFHESGNVVRYNVVVPYNENVPTDHRYAGTVDVERAPGVQQFQQLLTQDAEQYVPSAELRRQMLVSVHVRADRQSTSFPFDNRYRVTVTGVTVEDVKTLTRAFVQGYSAWWTQNGRAFVQEQLESTRKKLDDESKCLAKVMEQEKKDHATVGNLSLTVNTVSDLNTQQLLLDVDLRGVRAKVDSLVRMEKDPRFGGPAMQDQLALLRAAAQAELAGLLAKEERLKAVRDAADRLVSNVRSTPEKNVTQLKNFATDLEHVLAAKPFWPPPQVEEVRINGLAPQEQ